MTKQETKRCSALRTQVREWIIRTRRMALCNRLSLYQNKGLKEHGDCLVRPLEQAIALAALFTKYSTVYYREFGGSANDLGACVCTGILRRVLPAGSICQWIAEGIKDDHQGIKSAITLEKTALIH
ncbi:MAG: hypothetical protein NTX50_03835 [Candidatus Sumerlaeota bacterium]|nr:hypothetical protein [Candidatus Sumerlaeota bacterium]